MAPEKVIEMKEIKPKISDNIKKLIEAKGELERLNIMDKVCQLKSEYGILSLIYED